MVEYTRVRCTGVCHRCDDLLKMSPHIHSKCAHNNKPRFHSGTELSYGTCLEYRFLKNLGVGRACADKWALPKKCSLFDFMKELLKERGVSTDTAMIDDTDTLVQQKRLFTDQECKDYRKNSGRLYYSGCEYNSMPAASVFVLIDDIYFHDDSITCMHLHFMTTMGAKTSCSDKSVKVADYYLGVILDRLFYNFMVETLDAENICQDTNDVTFNAEWCDMYMHYLADYESHCAHDSREDSYEHCLLYRLVTSQGAETVCNVSQTQSCHQYHTMVQSLVPTGICVFGLIGNLLSLGMFCSGAVTTPTAYQLQWLAGVDITFILTWWIVEVLLEILHYSNGEQRWYNLDKGLPEWVYYLTPYQKSIVSILVACLRPLSYVARSCTVWLTVLIGLYRYLAVCHPSNDLTFHVARHGHKYVVLVVILSFLYNIPYFCEYYLHQARGWDFDLRKKVYYTAYNHTGFISNDFYDIYSSRVHLVVVVSIPCLILLFVTVSMLAELRKRKKKKKNMQTSQTSQNSITLTLVSILITFIICQLPYFVWYGFSGNIRDFNRNSEQMMWFDKKIKGCGDFMFYMRLLVDAGLLLNSSANGFIYYFLNKTFREALSARCHC